MRRCARVRSVADELDARIAMPVHETEVEVSDSLERHGRRPLRRLAELGLLRPGFTAVHMNRLDAEDLEPGAHGHLRRRVPAIESALGQRQMPGWRIDPARYHRRPRHGRRRRARRVRLLAEARCAALLVRHMLSRRGAEASHLGGAAALGLRATVGSIEPGKAADLICIDLDSLACQPDIPSRKAFCSAPRGSRSATCGSAAVPPWPGRLLAFDEQELLQLARSWARRIHGVPE